MDVLSRKLRAQAGGAAMIAKYGGDIPATRARQGKMARYLSQVDPEGSLTETERIRRAEALQRSKMLELARRSREVRSARKRTKEAEMQRKCVSRFQKKSPGANLGGFSQAI